MGSLLDALEAEFASFATWLGFHGYLTKPITDDDVLVHTIQERLAR